MKKANILRIIKCKMPARSQLYRQQLMKQTRIFATKSYLYAHQRIHRNHRPHRCTLCVDVDKRFYTKVQLQRHFQHVHCDERNFKCAYCEQTFKSKWNCESHMKTHLKHLLDEQPHSFEGIDFLKKNSSNEIIGKSLEERIPNVPKFIKLEMIPQCPNHKHRNFTIENLNTNTTTGITWKTTVVMNETSSAIASTSSSSSSQKSLQQNSDNVSICSYCSKSFQKPSDLQRHIRIHTHERPFHCEQCNKSFTLKSTLAEHQLTHLISTERTKVTCRVCGKEYASKKSLNVHQRLHTGLLPFKCNICEKLFRTSGHLAAHMKANKSFELCQNNAEWSHFGQRGDTEHLSKTNS